MNTKRGFAKRLLFLPMLFYSLALMLLPSTLIPGYDLRVLAMIVVQKRTLKNLQKQFQLQWMRFKILFTFNKNEQKAKRSMMQH